MPRKRKPAIDKTLPEPPMDELRKLVEVTPTVYLVLKRRDRLGRWQMLRPQAGFATQDLADGTIGQWLLDRHKSGGIYCIDVRDEETHTHQLVPRFEINVDGPAFDERLATRREATPQSSLGASSFGPARPGGTTMPHFDGPSAAGGFSPQDFMQHTPDAVALSWAQRLSEEKRQLEERLEKERDRHQQELEKERERTRKLEQEMRDAETRHRDAISDLRTEMLMKIREPAPQRDYASLVAAVVPVFTALIEAGSSRSRESMSAQQKSMELQMNSLQTFLTATAKKSGDDGGLSKLLELSIPLILKVMEDKSPAKLADVFATMSESNMATISLAVQALREMMPEESDDPLQKILTKALEGTDSVVQAYLEGKGVSGGNNIVSAPGQHEQPRQANGAAAAPQAQPISAKSTPKEIASAVYAGAPAPYRTAQWYRLFEAIHDSSIQPETVADHLSAYLDELYDKKQLPPLLAPVFEQSEGVAPSSVLRSFLEQLPVATFDPRRVEDICTAFDATFESIESSADAAEATTLPNAWGG